VLTREPPRLFYARVASCYERDSRGVVRGMNDVNHGRLVELVGHEVRT
jgi:hypothetical protein